VRDAYVFYGYISLKMSVTFWLLFSLQSEKIRNMSLAQNLDFLSACVVEAEKPK
jgi:hypothetical protein